MTKRTTIVAAQLDRQEVRRQSASLVRPGDDADGGESGEPAISSQADPAHKSDYDARLATFLASLKPIDDQVAVLNSHYKGVPVTATEPVFGYMSDAIGLDDAQPALPAGHDERHGTERGRYRRVREAICASGACTY